MMTSSAQNSSSSSNNNNSSSEALVPVRINFVHNDTVFSDYFMWNTADTKMTPEHFARQTCVDLDLPSSCEVIIAESIRTQIADSAAIHTPQAPQGTSFSYVLPTTVPATSETAIPEQIIRIQIDITIGETTLRDQFEWDVSVPLLGNPEAFALHTVRELRLPHEFIQAIALSIREQVAKALNKSPDTVTLFPAQPGSNAPVLNTIGGSFVRRKANDVLSYGPTVTSTQ